MVLRRTDSCTDSARGQIVGRVLLDTCIFVRHINRQLLSVLTDVTGLQFWFAASCALFVLQKEQLTLGSGRVGLRNVGNTVSLL